MNTEITLRVHQGDNVHELAEIMIHAFEDSVRDGIGRIDEALIPTEAELQELKKQPDVTVYDILHGENVIGGSAVSVGEAGKNRLELLFLSNSVHGKNIGTTVWKNIEALYPDTKIWETSTPEFAKRNINFYVNKCGFSIVEYYNKYHPHPEADEQKMCAEYGMFRFEKRIYD